MGAGAIIDVEVECDDDNLNIIKELQEMIKTPLQQHQQETISIENKRNRKQPIIVFESDATRGQKKHQLARQKSSQKR